MAYSNNTSLYYPTPPVSGEFGSYQFLGQTLTTEEVNGQAENTFNQWDTIRGWPGPMAGSPTSLRVTVSYVASVTSYENWGSGYDLPSYPGTFSPQLAAVSIPTAVIEGIERPRRSPGSPEVIQQPTSSSFGIGGGCSERSLR